MDSLEQLEAKIDSLRGELTSARAQFETAARTVRALEKAHATERAAMQRQRDQAGVCFTIEIRELKARVAELERELVAQELRHVRTREERADLDQARGLLERCSDEFNFDEFDDHVQVELQADVRDWLRAHPATACVQCEAGVCSKHQTATATPAATGADAFTTRHGDVIDISEKGQGT